MTPRATAIVLAGACAGALFGAPAAAQVVTVRGVAWDSLRAEPLPGAFVSVLGTGRTGAADARGRFQIDSVPPGSYTILLSHDALDSLGLTGVSGRFEVTDGRAEVRLSVPSFASFWNSGCEGRPPRDSSLVYGLVRRAGGTGAPIANAKVELAWLDTEVRGRREVQQAVKKLETTTDSTGAYGFCGVPAGAGFRVRASTEAEASGTIDLMPNPDRVRWRDLSVAALPGTDPAAVGIVSGQVMRAGNVPFPDARIVIDDAGEARTDSAGRFSLARVPAGTRQMQIQAVGLDPILRAVDVAPDDTARVFVNLDRVTTLGSVRVSGTPFTNRLVSLIDSRRAQGLGSFVDSIDLKGLPLMRSALSTISAVKLSSASRTPVITTRAGCVPTIFIDGVDQRGQETIWALNPDEIALIEIYPSQVTLPVEFQGPRKAGCAVVVWTKRVVRR